MPADAPIPGKFDEDPRVHYDKTAGKWQYEDEETGQEYEWSDAANTWIPLIDEADWKAQQQAYAVQGVDETTPSNAVIAREERRNKKRKKGEKVNPDEATNGGPSKPAPASAPKKTAVWVTNLPPNTTLSTLSSVFSKAGVLLIGEDGEPRIKMYYDDEGKFKGEALIMYFKEGSVDLAITLLDDSELEIGAGFGNMRVRVAEYDKGQGGTTSAKESGTKGEKEEKAEKEKRKPPTAEEKLRMTKRIRKMQEKLTWHSDSDSDDYGAPTGGAPKPGENRNSRVVVLKGMFTLEDLEKEPELMLELKEDVREEAQSFGEVTSLILYDKEEDGVMTIKFKDPISAQACIAKMNGRWFDKRQIYAGVYSGRERYQRSGVGNFDDEEEGEHERLDKFAHWLVDGENEGES